MSSVLSARGDLGWRRVEHRSVAPNYPIFAFNLVPLVPEKGESISFEEARHKARGCFTSEAEAEFALVHSALIPHEAAHSGFFIFFLDAFYEGIQTECKSMVYMGHCLGKWYLGLWIGSTIPQRSFLLQPVTG